MVDDFEIIARGECNVDVARQAIWSTLNAEEDYNKVYAALCRWCWRAMVERRLDDELPSWHRLQLDTAARIVGQARRKGEAFGNAVHELLSVAERIRALADLVRMSVEAARTTPPEEILGRAHVSQILRLLTRRNEGYLEREAIRDELGLKTANLSRVLTLLAANGLIERQPRGKTAAFRATKRGQDLVAEQPIAHVASDVETMPSSVNSMTVPEGYAAWIHVPPKSSPEVCDPNLVIFSVDTKTNTSEHTVRQHVSFKMDFRPNRPSFGNLLQYVSQEESLKEKIEKIYDKLLQPQIEKIRHLQESRNSPKYFDFMVQDTCSGSPSPSKLDRIRAIGMS